MSLLSLILPALVPAVADGIRGVFTRLTGGAGSQPANVDEEIKLMQAQTERLKAVAELDKPTGPISAWVADLRASFRYVACGIIILWAIVLSLVPGVEAGIRELSFDLAGSAFSFIFGDRMYLKLRSSK